MFEDLRGKTPKNETSTSSQPLSIPKSPKSKGGNILSRSPTMPGLSSPLRKLSLPAPSIPTRSISAPSNPSAFAAQSQENAELDADLAACRRGVDLFLNSHMNEAENLLKSKYKESMYFTLGYSFISYLRALMTFQQSDLEKALEGLKETVSIASSLRKHSGGIFESVGNWVRGVGGIAALKVMTRVQRHAELVYAESYLLKAILSIIHDETFVSFLREGLNIRASYATYRGLHRFLEVANEEAKSGEDISHYELDEHFISGVSLGFGLFNLMLSLLPSRVLKIFEIIGFQGDRDFGLNQLESVGGWNVAPDPDNDHSTSRDGVRRQFCDMSLIAYHVVVSGFIPIRGVNIAFAERILDYNLKLYPRGVFFLYFAGRLQQIKTQLPEAIKNYRLSISIQKEWKQLHHICYWELLLLYYVQQEHRLAYEVADILCRESNWSKAVYTYHKAVALYNLNKEENNIPEVESLMKEVPGLLRRIAGKSIPIEKYVARKARKFTAQGNRLFLADLELLNVWNGYEIMPLADLHGNLARVKAEISNLNALLAEKAVAHEAELERQRIAALASKSSSSFFSLSSSSFFSSSSSSSSHTTAGSDPAPPYENFYDDLCLAYFLQGILARQIAFFPKIHAHDPSSLSITQFDVELVSLAETSFNTVFTNASMITLDHYIFFFAHYEMGRTFVLMGDREKARHEFSIVLSHEGPAGATKTGKYSLENMLQFKCHNAVVELDDGVVKGKGMEEWEEEKEERIGVV